MNKFTVKGLLFSLVFGLSSMAQANLIVNGDFEDVDVANGAWNHFAAADVGWSGDRVEIWDSLGGIEAHSGEQHAELNAHGNNSGNWEIYQTFYTDEGMGYDFGFAYMARQNDSEAFLFEILGENGVDVLFSMEMNDHVKNVWSTLDYDFVADGDMATIRFSSITPESATVGNFLDAVYVEGNGGGNQTSVPEPSTLLIFSLALLGLNWRRVSASLQRK